MEPGAIVLGVDPGTAVTGYGVVVRSPDRELRLVECGVIRTRSKNPLADRLKDIHEGIVELILRHRPAAVAVENVYHGKNARTALVLGHARGAILLAAALHDIEPAEYSPREIKKAVVGNGNATKDQVGFMVQRRLRLKEPPSPSDAADGVAAALCHFMSAGLPR